MKIEENQLKSDIKDYFGTAMFNGVPAAIMNLKNVDKMSGEELCNIAVKIGLDIAKYQINL